MHSEVDEIDERAERAKVLSEQRYRAVLEVRDGHPVGEVASRYGVTRQTVTAWRRRYEQFGIAGLQELSRRPHHSPRRLSADIEAAICEMRRLHRRWGARRIVHELTRRGVEPTPSPATVHRVLVRNGLVRGQDQQRRRKYKRWQREAPMQLWQMDIVGGVFLADGRECKLVTGIDDHSRYIVIAHLVVKPTGRAVVEAFTAAMRRYGVPSEVLTDNGKQFTGRFTRPFPAEVLFERVCRENGIGQRLTKRRSPTTTGKIERFHKTLRTEFLDEVTGFDTLDAAQEAIDGWVHAYNHTRPHQALGMAVPASLFRPTTPQPLTVPMSEWHEPSAEPDPLPAVIDPAPRAGAAATAVEFEHTVPPRGVITIAQAQSVWVGPMLAGRIVTIWADDRSLHISLDGHHVKTLASRLQAEHLHHLRLRGARTAGPEPAAPALPGNPGGRLRMPENTTIEVDRIVGRDGVFQFRNESWVVDAHLVGQQVTLRLDGHTMHAVVSDVLVKSWPYPITLNQRLKLRGARQSTTPPPSPPAHAPRAERRVPLDGVIMVARQRLRVGRTHAGKLVTIYAEDTHFRILDGDTEIAVHPRTTTAPLTRFKAWNKRQTKGTDVSITNG